MGGGASWLPNPRAWDSTTVAYMAFNFFSATAIVFINKVRPLPLHLA